MSKMDFTPAKFIVTASLFLLIVTLLVISCAEIGAPPGGPVDKTKPRIINSEPLNGSVNVPIGNTITLFFSERITPPLNRKAVYISPYLKGEPEIDWKSDKVIITLPDSFEINRTYIIALGSGIQDLRRNPLDSGSIVAFSTGKDLSSGRLSGYIDKNDEVEFSKMLVGLYDSSIDRAAFIDSVYPDYIAAVKDDGFFSFQFLPDSDFKMIAFVDRNKDERFNPAKEYFAVPDRAIQIDTAVTQNYNLTFNNIDTSKAEIQSVAYNSNRLLTVRFTKKIDLTRIQDDLSQVRLISLTDPADSFTCRYMLESELTRHNSFSAYFGSDIPAGIYSCQIGKRDRPYFMSYDSLEITAREDKVSPSIRLIQPDSLPVLSDELTALSIRFSESIDTAKINRETFVLRGSDSLLIPLTARVVNQSYFTFNVNALKAGDKYSWIISEFDLYDLSGNPLGDSTSEYTIQLISPDSIGSVAGRSTIELTDKKESPVNLTFTNVKTNQTYQHYLLNRSFTVKLPSGKYRLTGCIDENENNKRDLGSVLPYIYSETSVAYPDTIAVRARFETAEINLTFK